MNEVESIKLQKYISDCGLMSRRSAESEIESGRFTINGVAAKLGDRVNPSRDIVKYKGTVVKKQTKKYYIWLTNPAGTYTTITEK